MSIINEAFEAAITTLYDEWQRLEPRTEWQEMKLLRQYDIAFLRIAKRMQTSAYGNPADDHQLRDTEHLGDDPEALQANVFPAQSDTVVTFDIVHSVSYQVPVLHFTVKRHASAKSLGITEIRQLLVPYAFGQQIEAVGVMGALSMTDHPVTGMPAFFVHPCRTQEAMQSIVGDKNASPVEYLMLWLGLAGASVGLNVPVELMQALKL